MTEAVAELLHYWKPDKDILRAPKFIGLSNTEYVLDFLMDGEAVLVSEINSNAISSALKKMVDIAGRDRNVKFRVMLEDRNTTKTHYKAQSTILSTMGQVTPISTLIARQVKAVQRAH